MSFWVVKGSAAQLLVLVGLLMCACSKPSVGLAPKVGESQPSEKDAGLERVSSKDQSQSESGSESTEAPVFFRTSVDLRNNRYLAHLYRRGLFAPLNDPGVAKYLPAHGKSGLQEHVSGSRRSLRVVGRHGVLNFNMASSDCETGCWIYLSLEQRIKKQYLGVFVNKQALRTQAVPEGLSLLKFRIPAGVIRDGENRLRFYFARKTFDGGQKVSADLRWLAFSADEDPEIKANMTTSRISDGAQGGLNFRDFSKWMWNLALPPSPFLEISWKGVGDAPFRVEVECETQETTFAPVAHSEPGMVRFDLRAFSEDSGGLARLSIEALEPVIVSDARIVVPHKAIRAFGEKKSRKVILWVMAGFGAGESEFSLGKLKTFESLAKKGVLFPDAVTQSPSPWRALVGLLTGLEPHRARALLEEDLRNGRKRLLPWILKKQNWVTALFSGEAKYRRADMSKAFQEIYDFQPSAVVESGKAFLPHLEDWLETNKTRSFFISVVPWSRHAYFKVRQGYTDSDLVGNYRGNLGSKLGAEAFSKLRNEEKKIRNRDRAYIEAIVRGEAAFQDKLLGELLTKLQELEIHDETLLVVVGASGLELFHRGGVGVGHSLYNEITSVPILFVHPESWPQGVRVDSGAEIIDVAPTILTAVGYSPPPTMKGGDLMGVVKSEFLSPPRPGFSRKNAFEHSLSMGGYRLMRALGQDDRVFDLRSDPDELSPLEGRLGPAVSTLRDVMAFHIRYGKRWRKARHGLPSNQSETFAEDSKFWWGK